VGSPFIKNFCEEKTGKNCENALEITKIPKNTSVRDNLREAVCIRTDFLICLISKSEWRQQLNFNGTLLANFRKNQNNIIKKCPECNENSHSWSIYLKKYITWLLS
jgi:hypothetical protein